MCRVSFALDLFRRTRRPQCLKVLFTSALESTTDQYTTKKGYFDARIRIYYQVSEQRREKREIEGTVRGIH